MTNEIQTQLQAGMSQGIANRLLLNGLIALHTVPGRAGKLAAKDGDSVNTDYLHM